jgi:hypothetical protein
MLRIRHDKPLHEADSLAGLEALLRLAGASSAATPAPTPAPARDDAG